MNKNIARGLIMAEQRWGALTKVAKAKQAITEFKNKVLVPDGYVLIPDNLPSGDKTLAFRKDLGNIPVLEAKKIYRNFIERFSV